MDPKIERLIYAAHQFMSCAEGTYQMAKEQDQPSHTEGRISLQLFTSSFEELQAALEAIEDQDTEPE